ncbi:hypothetical protein Tco_0490697 [Tanacetum coccineum]
MVVFYSCPKHNMVAYLEKSEGNEEFHDIIDFLKRSSIHFALTVKQLVDVSSTFRSFSVHTLTSKVFSFMVKIGTIVEAQTNTLSCSPLVKYLKSHILTIPAPDVKNLGGHSSINKSSYQGYEGDYDFPRVVYDLCLSLCKTGLRSGQGIKGLKAQITKLRSMLKLSLNTLKQYLSVSLEAKIPKIKASQRNIGLHKESGSKHGWKGVDEVRLSTEDEVSTLKDGVSTDFEKVSTDRPIVSTDGSKVSTDRQVEGAEEQVKGTDKLKEGTDEHNESTEELKEGTDEHNESTEEQIEGTEEKVEGIDGQMKGTKDQTEEEIATQATQTFTQTPTSKIFGDDETIAKVLLNMSQAKAASREKEKGVELKDVEETDRPKPTSTRSLLTLKPLPKIDPKDKGKKKIEEEDESESESDGIPQAEKKIEADRLLAEKLQEQEREQFTIEERAKFLHDTIAAQRKFLAQQRSEAIRNKPPTKNQLRNQMMTYLKHVGNYKHAELKIKKFEEVQALYEKIKRSDEDFISIGSAEDEKLIKRMNEREFDLSKSDVIKEGKAKMKFRRKEDLNAVYQLGDLMVLFNPDDKDEFWSSQLDWIIVSWKLHSSSGVHTLVTDTGLIIHMLVEKKYPLRKEVLVQMLKLKLESEEENTMALELIKFVKKILAELESEERD